MDLSGLLETHPDFIPQERRAWIYLLQERHQAILKTNVYKVGKTTSALYEPFTRMAHYRGGVDLHLMIQVPLEKVDALETDIKIYLERVYGPPVSGTESFAGDLQEMRRIVAELCLDSFTWPGGILQGILRGTSAGAGTGSKKTHVVVEKEQ
jgi:hypothetical protein